VIPQYLQDQVSLLKTPDPRPLLPPASPRPSSSPASSSTVTPKQPPARSDQGYLPSASQKLESDLLLARYQIEENRVIDGKTILKFKADYNVKPGDLAQLWCAVFLHSFLDPFQQFRFHRSSSTFDKNNRLTGASLDLFLGRLREKAAGQAASDPPPYPTEKFSPSYSVHVDDGFSTDPSRNSAQNGPWSPPFPVMKLDSHASPIPFPRRTTPYHPYKSYSPSSSDVSNYNPDPSDAISPTSPVPPTAPPTNEPLSTTALEEIKAETATLIRHVESNFLRQFNQRNRLQSANQMLSDENLVLQSKVRDLEMMLSDCILPSKHRILQHQYTQEVGRLTANLQRTTELLASLRDQHEAQEAALRECQANLANSYAETERLRQSADAQVSLIADLRIQLEGKEKDIADLISKMDEPDMPPLYVKASLRESEASLAKAQDETKNLHHVIAIDHEDISKLPVRLITELMPSSVADDGLFQSLAQGQNRLSFEVKEVRQMMEQFISSDQSRRTELNTHPMAQYRDNMDARSSIETIRMGLGSRPDQLTNHGFHAQPTLPPAESGRSTSPVRIISASANFYAFPGNSTTHSSERTETNHNSFWHSPSTGGGSVERYLFSDIHPLSNESAPDFDAISAFEQSPQTSQATTTEPFPYENIDDLGLPNPSYSRDMGHLEDAELQKIKMEGVKLSLQIERCLQQQIIAQTHALTPVLADHSHVKYSSLMSERDVERRQHQEEINLLAEKLRNKEAECKSLKTQNPLQTDLADAKKRIERLRETVSRQNEEIFSLQKNQSYSNALDPPSYEERPVFSSSSVS